MGTRAWQTLPRPLLRWLLRARGVAYAVRATARSALGRRDALPPGSLDCVIARNRHGSYCVPRSARARPSARAVLQGRVWEPRTLDLLCRTPGDVVHAGAFYGDFLPALSRSRRVGELVFGFEPNRESYRCAAATVLLNDLHNVRLAHAALSSCAGSSLLATSVRDRGALGGSSRLLGNGVNEERVRTESVDLVALDDVLAGERRVGAIHLDVEGHVRQALTGARTTIERCRPLLVLEGAPNARWIATLLEPLGYRMDGWVHANMVFSTPAPVGAGDSAA